MSFGEENKIPIKIALWALNRFIEPKAMNIQGLGEKLTHRLVVKGLLAHPVDLYQLDLNILIKGAMISPHVANKIHRSLGLDHTVALCNVIYALNIPTVGHDYSVVLAMHYKTLRAFKEGALEQDDLPIPQEIKDNIADWVNTKYNQLFLEVLMDRQVGTKEFTDPNEGKPLVGQRWYITVNSNETLSLRKRIINLGGTIARSLSSSVSKVVLTHDEFDVAERCHLMGIEAMSLKSAYGEVGEKETLLPKPKVKWE